MSICVRFLLAKGGLFLEDPHNVGVGVKRGFVVLVRVKHPAVVWGLGCLQHVAYVA